MAVSSKTSNEWRWRCLHCNDSLVSDAMGLCCVGCNRNYPVIAGIPVLVREPAEYLRSELGLLIRALHDAHGRLDRLDRIGREIGLPKASVDRHRDVLEAEIAQIETFLIELEPAAQALGDAAGDPLGAWRTGWTVEALIPYILRDWTGTPELAAAAARIERALDQSFSDASGKSVVVAAAGAGGLLAEIPCRNRRVLGFDLTLPVLVVARRLLEGHSVDLALPHTICHAGRITLRRRERQPIGPWVNLAAMDAFNTAFADSSVDCVITSFLIDLIPEPVALADEIRRILRDDGVWINYGPSGPQKALWRFDEAEGGAFAEAAGFSVIRTEAYRTTYLDLSRDCPSWSFQNHICYLIAARKSGRGREKPAMTMPDPVQLPDIIPEHLPGAHLIRRQSLRNEQTDTILFRHEAIPGYMKRLEMGRDAAQIMALVDGKRTVGEIAQLLAKAPNRSVNETIQVFTHYFEQGLLTWRGR